MKKKKENKIIIDETTKDIYNLIKRKRSEKYLLISSILEELETKYDLEIKEFSLKNKVLEAKVGDNNIICVDLSKDL